MVVCWTQRQKFWVKPQRISVAMFSTQPQHYSTRVKQTSCLAWHASQEEYEEHSRNMHWLVSKQTWKLVHEHLQYTWQFRLNLIFLCDYHGIQVLMAHASTQYTETSQDVPCQLLMWSVSMWWSSHAVVLICGSTCVTILSTHTNIQKVTLLELGSIVVSMCWIAACSVHLVFGN